MPERMPVQHDVEMVRLGKRLVAQLFVLLKTSYNYSEGHQALEIPVARVLDLVREIHRADEEAAIRMKGNHLYLGQYRLKIESGGFEAARFLMEEMRRHLVGTMTLAPEVTAEELQRFVYALREVDEVPGIDPYARILERMQQRKIERIEVETLTEEAEAVEIDRERLKDDRLKARHLYKRAVAAMEEVMRSAGAGQPIRFRECKRVVQQMIDLLTSHESCLLGLTANRCHDTYDERHAINVCILSLSMGRRLGISKFNLCELGMAALFHDIGKADLPPSLLGKQGELTPHEEQLLEAHPLYGVKKVIGLKALDTMTSRIIAGVFEHHLMADYSGYPRLGYKRLSLFGRIISIADSYDALTSSVGGRSAYSPEKTIRFMLTRGGKEYDRALLKLFLSCVGLYGVGSLLLLDSRELAVLVENHRDAALWETPRVRVIADAGGRETGGDVVDLAHATPRRSILAAVDPSAYGVETGRYLL